MLVFPDPNDSTEYTDPNGDKWEFNGTGWVRQPDCSGGGGDGWNLGPVPEKSKVWAWDVLIKNDCVEFGVGLYDAETQEQEFLHVIKTNKCAPSTSTSTPQTDRAGNLYFVVQMIGEPAPVFMRVNFDGSGYSTLALPLDAPRDAFPDASAYDGEYIYWFNAHRYWVYSTLKGEFVDAGSDFPNAEVHRTKYIPDLNRFYSFGLKNQRLLSYTLDGGWQQHATTAANMTGITGNIGQSVMHMSYRSIEGISQNWPNNLIQSSFHRGGFSVSATAETIGNPDYSDFGNSAQFDGYVYNGSLGWDSWKPSSLRLDPQRLADTISDFEPENPDDLHVWHDTKNKAFFRYDAEGESWFQLFTEEENRALELANTDARSTPSSEIHMNMVLNSGRASASYWSNQGWWSGSWSGRNFNLYDLYGGRGGAGTGAFYDYSTVTVVMQGDVYRLNAFNQTPITLMGTIIHPDNTDGDVIDSKTGHVDGRQVVWLGTATEIMFYGYE
jgi:hypothetical protein